MSEVVALTIVLKVVPIQLLLNYKKYADAVLAMGKISEEMQSIKENNFISHNRVELLDDYGHRVVIILDQVAAVLITDIAQQNEVQAEIALMTARTQSKIDKIAQQERLSSGNRGVQPANPHGLNG